jgi:hypothetical protein
MIVDADADQPGIEPAVATVLATAHNRAATPADLLHALVLLHRAQHELADLEPALIRAARAAGVS